MRIIGFISTLSSVLLHLTSATYSIVATNQETRQVGGAGATCIPNVDLFPILYFSIPNKGVLHRQAYFMYGDDDIPNAGLDVMQITNASVYDVRDTMVTMDIGQVQFVAGGTPYWFKDVRQYAIADFDSQVGYTGSALYEVFTTVFNFEGAEDSEQISDGGAEDDFIYHAAANIVTNGTVQAMKHGFLNKQIDHGFGLCDIAGKLMNAIYNVGMEGHGDVRCTVPYGTTASTGYLHVDNPDGTEYIHINSIGDGTTEVLEELKDEFMIWRQGNPCKCGPDPNPKARFFDGRLKTKPNGKKKPKTRSCKWLSNAGIWKINKFCSMTRGYWKKKPARKVCTGTCNSC